MAKYLFPKGKDNPRYKGDVTLTCQMCDKQFVRNRMKKNAKFCSIDCSIQNLRRPEVIARRAETATGLKRPNANYKRGEESPYWLGDDVSYMGLHSWLRNKYGSAKVCVECGKKGQKVNGRWNIQWSNNSGLYKRDRKDFSGRCVKCHKHYDLKVLNKIQCVK